jgi:hypothetical protein
MKTLMKAGSVFVLVAIMTSSCSVEYKNRHGRHNVIDVGMNEKKLQNNQVATSTVQSKNGIIAVAGK